MLQQGTAADRLASCLVPSSQQRAKLLLALPFPVTVGCLAVINDAARRFVSPLASAQFRRILHFLQKGLARLAVVRCGSDAQIGNPVAVEPALDPYLPHPWR